MGNRILAYTKGFVIKKMAQIHQFFTKGKIPSFLKSFRS
jgi:hypothetical protein